jgi:hypothetical protein
MSSSICHDKRSGKIAAIQYSRSRTTYVTVSAVVIVQTPLSNTTIEPTSMSPPTMPPRPCARHELQEILDLLWMEVEYAGMCSSHFTTVKPPFNILMITVPLSSLRRRL